MIALSPFVVNEWQTFPILNICFRAQKKMPYSGIFLLHLAGIEPAASESESDVLSIKLQPHIFFYLFHIQPIYHSR